MHLPDGIEIRCCDCLGPEGLPTLPDASVDAVVTDPPFGIGQTYGGVREEAADPDTYWRWFRPYYTEMLRVLRPGGFFACWQTQLYFRYFWDWFGDDIHIYCAAKNFVQMRPTAINYAYDPVIMFYKPGESLLRPRKPLRSVDFFVANTAPLVSDANRPEKAHPCPRPLDQVMEIVENFTLPGGLVLDPFLGSGTTAEACYRLGRRCKGFELKSEYVEIAVSRLRQQRLVL